MNSMYDSEWDVPLWLIAREDNNNTIAQQQEDMLTRRGHGTQRRRNMLHHDGPHSTHRRHLNPACIQRLMRRSQRMADRQQLQREALAARDTTPDDVCGLPAYGAAEDYVSGTYPYFDEETLLAYNP